MNWGLSDKGFYRPNQNEIKAMLDARTREEFGANVNLNYKSPNGILNGIWSWFFARLWEMGERVYHSSHPSQAVDVQLDYLTMFFGTARRRPQYSEGTLKFTGTPFYVIPAGRLYKRSDGAQFVLLQSVALDASGVGYGDISALDTGVFSNSNPNSITEQVEPDSDITAVTNEQATEGGAAREGDVELRRRLANSYAALGSGTINAIYPALLEVPGVRAVRVKVNETSSVKDGLPPHSIAVYTYGGNETEIAEALMKNYTGIQYFGTTQIPVKDISGNEHIIGFSKATTVEIEFRINIVVDNTFSSDGETTVRDSIINVVGGVDSNGNARNGYNMGDDVIYPQIISAVMNVQGVTNTTVEMSIKGSGSWVTTDIPIDDMEVANTSLADITVTR